MESSTKILMVDDDLRNLRILEEILADDFDTKQAINGTEALEKAKSFMPDIILLDIMMPDIDGLEVCRRLRADKELAYTKVILISGKARQDEKLEGYDAGADDYITKPFNDDELLAKIKVFAKLKFSEELSLLKSTFIDLLSHETQTSLSTIIGYSSLLLQESGISEVAQNHIEKIKEAGGNLTEKINRLMLLNSLRSNEVCEFSAVPVEVLISGVLGMIEDERKRKEINIKLTLSNDVKLECCIDVLMKGIYYIVENAVKFSENNGEIEIFDEFTDDNKKYSINIRDNGAGLSNAVEKSLFSDFNIPDMLHHQSGMGVSLAISQLIIHKHHGTIAGANNDEAGAIFTITFPVES